jgi:hypothetical protein
MPDRRIVTSIGHGDEPDEHDELAELRAEIEHLRALLGPSEEAYTKLRLDVLAARDAAIGAELELGNLKGYNAALEAEVVRLQRDFLWFRERVVMRFRRLSRRSPLIRRVVSRLSR